MNRIVINRKSYHGDGCISMLAHEASYRNYKKAFICVNEDLVKFHVTDRVFDLLKGRYIDFSVYTGVMPDPTIENVKDGLKAFSESGADFIIAIGGGSSIDTAKAISVVASNPEYSDIRSLEGRAELSKAPVPIIAVPTTAGTASETTAFFVISDKERNRKFVCYSNLCVPKAAIVDPEMMTGMPKGLTASTGMDALTHAIESYITKGAWDYTDMFSIHAIELIAKSLPLAVKGEMEGRRGMAKAQYYAGVAFSNAGLGLVHSMAHVVGAFYHIPHGLANAIILPTVMRFNAEVVGSKFKDIAKAMGVHGTDKMTKLEYDNACIDAVIKLSREIGIPENLQGILKQEDMTKLVDAVMKDFCLSGNPKAVTKQDVETLFKELI